MIFNHSKIFAAVHGFTQATDLEQGDYIRNITVVRMSTTHDRLILVNIQKKTLLILTKQTFTGSKNEMDY